MILGALCLENHKLWSEVVNKKGEDFSLRKLLMFSRLTVYSDDIRAAIICWIVEGKIDINDLISNEETVFSK